MMRSTARVLQAATLAMLLAADPLGAQATGAPSRDERLVRVPVVGAVVDVHLARGDVHISRGRAGVVRIVLETLPGRGGVRPAPGSLAVVERTARGVRIGATDAGRGTHGVRLALEVPESVAVRVRLERGDVSVAGTAGALELSTARGDVRLDGISGSALVDVTNGNVRATFRELDPTRANIFATLNGNVDLVLPRDAALELDVRCRGCTLAEALPGRSLRRTRLAGPVSDPVVALHGSVGGGGPRLQVFTWNGEVSIATGPGGT